MATTGVCATQHQLTGLVLHSLYEDIEQQHRLTDATMASLHAMLGLHVLTDALAAIDEQRITRAFAPSGKSVFLVEGSEQYVCLPESGKCSCMAFQFSVVARGDALACKHAIAARIAMALDQYKRQDISEEQLVHFLLK